MNLRTYIKEEVVGLKNTDQSYQNILQGPLHFYDVGAATGLQPQWTKVRDVGTFFLFEPHEPAMDSLKEMYANQSRFHFCTDALSQTEGDSTLSVTSTPTGSTLLDFDSESEGVRYTDRNSIYPIKEVKLKTRRLDQIIREKKWPQPDLLKLDTQSSEPWIFEGLGEFRKSLVCFETEIGLVRSFRDQIPYYKFLESVHDLGFEAYDFRVSRALIKRTGDNDYFKKTLAIDEDPSFFVSSRSWEFDTVFFRSVPALLQEGDPTRIRKLIASFCVYNFYFDAIDLIDRASEKKIFSNVDSENLRNNVKQIIQAHRARMKVEFIKNFGRLSPNPQFWARFLWTRYPNT